MSRRDSREDVPEHIAPNKRGSAPYSGKAGNTGGMRRPSYDEMRQQFEELKERHRVQWGQLQAAQNEKDKAIDNNRRLQENSKTIWKKMEDMKRDYSQRGQISRFDHEKLAKHYEQVCAQNRLLQPYKERLEHFSQERQEVEGRLLDDLKNIKLNLEEAEQDRDNLLYKLSEKKRELDRLNEQLKYLGPNQDTKKEIAKVLTERDTLRSKLSELKQEKQNVQEKLKAANKSLESMKSQMPMDQRINDMQLQISSLQQLVEGLRREKDEMAEVNNDLRRNLEMAEIQLRETDVECQRLRHAITELRGISPSRRGGPMDRGGMPLSHGSSEEMLTIKRYRNSAASRGRSQGSTDDDYNFVSSDNSENPNSLSDLAALTRSDSGHMNNISEGGRGLAPLSVTHSGGEPMTSARRKLGKFSSSTSNLSNEMYERGAAMSGNSNKMLVQKAIRLEKSLEEAKKENSNLQAKVSELEHEKGELSSQVEELEKKLGTIRSELESNSKLFKNTRAQIDMLNKEKGVAMRDNAASYEHSIQMETQLRELQAEKQILEQRRAIAEKEMERVITESVSNKKKLEAIKSQRQKDGNELSAMRHLKEKALQEAKDMKRRLDDVRKSKVKLEEELANIRETVHRAAVKLSPHPRQKGMAGSPSGSARNGSTESSGLTQDLAGVMERLHQLENERKVVIKKLFGPDSQTDQPLPLADVLHKVESMVQERDDLIVEIEALQQSSSKLSEDRIYELKQRIEDILMDKDSLEGHNKSLKREVNSLSSILVKTEQERDKLSIDCERLDLQCQQFKSRQARLVEEHAKTLERVTELWKQKWPVNWDEAWEEKHVSVPLDQDGLAGFSVVGGRDQPQLPNPGAFIITVVNQGGPAEGLLKPGDILESVNGINLSNADHREAVRAVKETKRNLSIVFKRRRNVYPISVGIIQPVNATPQLMPMVPAEPELPKEVEYSLYITGKEKSDLGFRYDWSTVCTVASVISSGPADQILEKGDRIVKVNNTDITHEKPSAVKKLMKPHKNILRLTIERPPRGNVTWLGQQPQLTSNPSWSPSTTMKSSTSAPTMEDGLSLRKHRMYGSESSTPVHKEVESDYTQQSLSSHASFSTLDKLGPDSERAPLPSKDSSSYVGAGATSFHYKTNSRDSCSSRDSYSDTQSQDSGNKPTKLASVITCVKREQAKPVHVPATRPSSDGVMYGNFNERRIEYEEVLESERSDSQFSQSESYLSESSYDYGLSSSQSIDLTFHTVSTIPTHNRLTVDTVMTTQAPSQQSEDEDGVGFLARDDASRTTFRTRNPGDPLSNSNTNNSELLEDTQPSQLSESQTLSQEFKRDRRGIGLRRKQRRRHKSNTLNGSRNFSKSSSDQNLARGSGSLSMWGRSRSNLSLGRAPSMTSVIEEPRRSTSTTDMMAYEHDPLADATYIRANFTYIPRNPKELHIKSGDVFHIHDEAPPERFRSSFWVSRLNADGTDEQIGAIPNSIKAQDYLETQGECLDFALYEEVEAYTRHRPVVIFGALADQVVTSLLESFPKMFFPCTTDHIEGVARLTEARLRRDVTEGRIVDFRHIDGGFEVVRVEAITRTQNKSKHCLMTGTPHALQTLKAIAPPITILVKAMTQESITTFSPEHISHEQAKEIFDSVTELEDTHGHEFTASLFLIYMETLMGQIEDIIKAETRNQAWVPVTRSEN